MELRVQGAHSHSRGALRPTLWDTHPALCTPEIYDHLGSREQPVPGPLQATPGTHWTQASA